MDPSPADRVRALREQYGSHDKLAAALGTSRQRVIDWEKGGQPSRRYRQALAELGGLPSEAFAYSEQKRPNALREIAEVSRKIDALQGDVERIVSALGLDEGASEPQEPAQLLSTVVSLEQQIARLLEALGGPDAARWLNGSKAERDGVAAENRASRRAR